MTNQLSRGWVGSCDGLQEQFSAVVEFGEVIYDELKEGNYGFLIDVLEDAVLPDRCQRGSFELDYCVGYVVATIGIKVLAGGGALGAASLTARIMPTRLPSPPPRMRDVVPCPGRSFGGDTLILMADGSSLAISEIEVGDRVWATDPETDESAAQSVTATWPHHDLLLELEFGDGSRIVTTEDHHFWNASDGEWQESQDFDAGDAAYAPDGSLVAVQGLDWSTVHYAEAFDLTVGDIHSYYVHPTRGPPVLVHNCGGGDAPKGAVDDLAGLSCRSFSRETEVVMADGTTKPISEVEVGDWVLAEDPETGNRAPQTVVRTLPHLDQLLVLETNVGRLWTTEDHLFWNLTDGEWQESQQLDPGNALLSSTSGSVEVIGLDWQTARVDIAYDLDVSGFDTFFVSVGDESALVHNIECPWQLKFDDNFQNMVLDGPLPQTGQLSQLTRDQLLDLQSDLTTSIANRQRNLWDGTFPTVGHAFEGHAARVGDEIGLLNRVNDLLG